MPDFFIDGNLKIETNIIDWSAIKIKIKVTNIFEKCIQHVHQLLCHIMLGCEGNHIKSRPFQILRALIAPFVKVQLTTHFARSGHI